MPSERDKPNGSSWQFTLRKMFLAISVTAVGLAIIVAIDKYARDYQKVTLTLVCALASLLWFVGIRSLIRGELACFRLFPTPPRPDNDPLQYWSSVFGALLGAAVFTVLTISTLLFGTS